MPEESVILITGATGAIGQPLAVELARRGATLILLGHHVRKLERLHDRIQRAKGTLPALYPFNLEGAAADDYEQLASTIEQEFGRLDAVLNLAALWGRHTPLAMTALDDWARVQHVNVTAPLALSQACLPLLQKTADSQLLFMLDAVATGNAAYWSAYGVSKAALAEVAGKFSAELESVGWPRLRAYDPGGDVNTASRQQIYPAGDESAWRKPVDVAVEIAELLLSN